MLEDLAPLIKVADNKTVSDTLRSNGVQNLSGGTKLAMLQEFLSDRDYSPISLLHGLAILPALGGITD